MSRRTSRIELSRWARRHSGWFCVAALLLLVVAEARAAEPEEQLQFRFGGHQRLVFFWAPPGSEARPAIILLHGSGRDGRTMLRAWKMLAEAEHLILIAPDAQDAAAWDSDQDSPAFLEAAVAEVGRQHAIDPAQLFLFGHSGGAVYALALAAHNPAMFRAVAVHAGALPPSLGHLFRRDQGTVPLGLWVGEHDPLFPAGEVQATAAVFRKHGFPVQLTVLSNQGHPYEGDAAEINTQVWMFFRRASAPEGP